MKNSLKKVIIFCVLLFLIAILTMFILRTVFPTARLISSNMEPTYSKGDLIFYSAPKDLAINDVIIFQPNSNANNIVTRIISINPDGSYVAKGDANSKPLNATLINENNIQENMIVGKVKGSISPYIFYPLSYGIQAILAILLTFLIGSMIKNKS